MEKSIKELEDEVAAAQRRLAEAKCREQLDLFERKLKNRVFELTPGYTIRPVSAVPNASGSSVTIIYEFVEDPLNERLRYGESSATWYQEDAGVLALWFGHGRQILTPRKSADFGDVLDAARALYRQCRKVYGYKEAVS